MTLPGIAFWSATGMPVASARRFTAAALAPTDTASAIANEEDVTARPTALLPQSLETLFLRPLRSYSTEPVWRASLTPTLQRTSSLNGKPPFRVRTVTLPSGILHRVPAASVMG